MDISHVQATICPHSSLLPVKDGVIPLCFLRIILHGLNTIFILIFGSWRLGQVLFKSPVPSQTSKVYAVKIFVCSYILCVTLVHAVLPLIMGLYDPALGFWEPYVLISSGYIAFSWFYVIMILVAEKSRALPNNWVLQIWFTTSFFLESFTLQTQIALGLNLDFIIAVFIFPAGLIIVSLALF